MIVRVNKAGLLTTVQDRGRWGHQAMGVSVAGPMDIYSHRLANALAGNDEDAATLEATLVGPELEFVDERHVAVIGAEFESVANSVLTLRAGDPFETTVQRYPCVSRSVVMTSRIASSSSTTRILSPAKVFSKPALLYGRAQHRQARLATVFRHVLR